MPRGVGFEIMDTGAACRTYNVLVAEGRNVAAALIVEPVGLADRDASRQHEDRAKVVDVGPRRAGHHGVAERLEERVRVVGLEERLRIEAQAPPRAARCPASTRRPQRPPCRPRRRCRRRAQRRFRANRVPCQAPAGTRRCARHVHEPRTVTVVSPPDSSTHGGPYRPPFAHDVGHERSHVARQRPAPRPRCGPRVSTASRQRAPRVAAAASSDCRGAATMWYSDRAQPRDRPASRTPIRRARNASTTRDGISTP